MMELLIKVMSSLLHDRCKDQDKPLERIFRISQEKAKSLGLSFIPWDASLRETIESLKEKGFLSIWILIVMSILLSLEHDILKHDIRSVATVFTACIWYKEVSTDQYQAAFVVSGFLAIAVKLVTGPIRSVELPLFF
ncbi:hypothetical protein V6N11_078055 [Hibiscus sabdariffa]|uniref:Uncharacterized protein n=1 Tax=Hibiscus sabdariffa TaxID=183260 RepID=A0ABR2TFK5_9ROSI